MITISQLFIQSGTPYQSIIDTWKPEKCQPNLVCIGDTPSSLSTYFIVCDRHIIPIDSKNSSEAIDTLFKCHYVLGTEYDKNLVGVWKFIQVYIYKLDVDTSILPRKAKEVYGQLSSFFNEN